MDAAIEQQPCIVFFDEFESIASKRRTGGGSMDRLVGALCGALDRARRERCVFIIASTNRPELIDPSLLRPGRIDIHLCLDNAQTPEEIRGILRALLRKVELDNRECILHDLCMKIPVGRYSGKLLSCMLIPPSHARCRPGQYSATRSPLYATARASRSS